MRYQTKTAAPPLPMSMCPAAHTKAAQGNRPGDNAHALGRVLQSQLCLNPLRVEAAAPQGREGATSSSVAGAGAVRRPEAHEA
eukprot:CAMPEP_0115841906 /NCGR_PEP_ID=MMETSP0287-20121206/7528_1 /TAXON_ID=412157 /ORGANISM="Chrysochromulina rotalis, Strain UIO044" /LENGTH=82 /DNA_ID=CAMNT_0003295563 /DNA_START=109 /DNA_END=357 /DNA_ORIENTATION=+